MSYAGLNKGVFDKMPKHEVELSKMEVDLKSVAEIERIRKGVLADIDRLDAESKEVSAKESELDAAKRQYKNNVNLTLGGIGLLENTADEFAKKAAELGLGNQPIVQGTLKEAKTLKAKMKKHIDEAKRIK